MHDLEGSLSSPFYAIIATGGQMAYEVTATRKRPQDFDSLIGQEFVVSTLENAIKENRIAHAYLFSGPRGVGKTSSARLLAKALNCQEGLSAHPCGRCSSCIEIAKGSSVDVIEIDGASNNGVDAVRAIREEVTFPPQSSRYKIYIIDEVHMLSINAFNALLKTIEEPPEYVIFIFATTELQKVPQTIRSRCQQFHFQLISQENIVKCLKSAADDLGIEADEDALYWMAREGAGSMRDSYTLFDQVAAFSDGHITLARIREKLGIASAEQIANILSCCLSGDSPGAMSALEDMFSSGAGETQLVKDFTSYIRSLLFYKNGVRRAEVLSFAKQDMPDTLVDGFTKDQLETMMKAFLDLYRDMRFSLSPKFELELLVSRLCSIRNLCSPISVVEKLEEIRNGLKEGRLEIRTQAVPAPTRTAPAEIKKNSPLIRTETEADTGHSTREIHREEPLPQSEIVVDDGTFNRLSQKLRENGLSFEARLVPGSIKSYLFSNPRLDIVIESKRAFDAINLRKREIEAALEEITGGKILLSPTLFVKEAEKYSKEIEMILKTFKNAEVGELKQEVVKHEHKPVRADETTGLNREPDESDEGGSGETD